MGNASATAPVHMPMLSKHQFRLFLLTNLPVAWVCGLRLAHLNAEQASIGLSQSWMNKNPFGSIYFAVLQMAAEVSTGILAMMHIRGRKPGVSMLVVQSGAAFYKKATGHIRFVCTDGQAIAQAIHTAVTTGDSTTIRCLSKGYNAANDLVAECWFEWSFKQRSH